MHKLHLPSLTTSIANKKPINKLQLVSYPNPTIDLITLEVLLETSTSINLQLVELTGKDLENLDKGKKPQVKYSFNYNTQKLSAGSNL